jgi:predicted small metal-binding protein
MAKVIRCKDVGFNCEGVIRSDSEAELLTLVAAHAKEAHGIEEITPDVLSKVKAAIGDE